jgi:restriction endonuclease Mrr
LNDQGAVKRLVVMTSVVTARQRSENPYHDRMEGNILVYTGAGREGDQTLSGPNARIPQQLQDRFPIYGFMLMESRRKGPSGAKRWSFLGLMEFLRSYREQQIDTSGNLRWAWIFEIRVFRETQIVTVSDDATVTESLLAQSQLAGPLSPDDRQVINSQEQIEVHENRKAIEIVRAKLLSYEPREFEVLLQSLLIQSGFERVQVTRYSQDGGIDVNAFPGPTCWPIRDLLVQLQAKRWLHTVGRKDVAELRGSLQLHARGCLVTTSHFSRAALVEAREAGKSPIRLVDGYEMARIVTELGLSVPDARAST